MPLFETGTVEVQGGSVNIRELSVPQLREADKKGTEEMVTLMALLPEKVVSDQLANAQAQAVERVARFKGYDPEVLLRYGVTGWSFEEECTPESVTTELGAKKGEIVARAIFDLSVVSEGEVGSSSTPSPTDTSQDGQ